MSNPSTGLVYIVFDGSYYKIGYTENLPQRLKTIKSYNPNVELIHLIQRATYETERLLHKICKKQHIEGEWFDLNDFTIKWLCELKSHDCLFKEFFRYLYQIPIKIEDNGYFFEGKIQEIIKWDFAKVKFEGSNKLFEISLNKLLFKIRVHRIVPEENKTISILVRPEIYRYVNFEQVKNYLLESFTASATKIIQAPTLTSMLVIDEKFTFITTQ